MSSVDPTIVVGSDESEQSLRPAAGPVAVVRH
jgi:hypothetical protein